VASALFLKGDCLIRASRFEEAEASFSEILERTQDKDPVYGQMARYRLVECYKAAGRLADAAQALKALLEKLDKKVERALALKDLGEVLALAGDPEARAVLGQAAEAFKDVAQDQAMDPEFRAYAKDLSEQTLELAGKIIPTKKKPVAAAAKPEQNPGPRPRHLP
jgi:tetratricopeptide (TPR) repeat protein